MFFQQQEAKMLDGSFSSFVYLLTTIASFHSVGNFSFLIHDPKINSRDLQTEVSQVFTIRILITS